MQQVGNRGKINAPASDQAVLDVSAITAAKSLSPTSHNLPGKKVVRVASRLNAAQEDAAGSTMSNEHFQPHAPQHGSTPAAPSSTNSQLPKFPNSVVSDLMKVYESMTQSSTPQDAQTQRERHGHPPPPDHHQYQYPHHQEGSQHPYHYPQKPQYQQSDDYDQGHYHYVHQQPQHQGYYEPQSAGGYSAHPAAGAPIVPPVPEYPPTQDIAPSPVPPSTEQSKNSDRGGRALRNKRTLEEPPAEEERGSSKNRKKGADSDGRWSKRFTWPDDLHRDFVSAIFDVGLKHASPSAILDHMPKHEPVTSERIKSHLQKYRLHRSKAKQEFMTCYDSSMKKFQAGGLEGQKVLSSGEVAAHASYTTLTGTTESPTAGEEQQQAEKPCSPATEEAKPKPVQQEEPQGALMLPKLSEEEKRSPIGTSLGYLLGLFFSIRSQLMAERAAAAARAAESGDPAYGHPVGDLYVQFANDVMSGAPGHGSQPEPAMVWSTPVPADGGYQQQETPQDQKGFATASSSTRTNLEENTLMKREMKNQMLFQNKMRALKQQELDKYTKSEGGGEGDETSKGNKETETAESAHILSDPLSAQHHEEQESEAVMASYQGAGEAAEAMDDSVPAGAKERGLSVGNSEDFWHNDVVDEQLFEFLMNP
jgi:SHAQKYF class myb-like DNA-binding protein